MVNTLNVEIVSAVEVVSTIEIVSAEGMEHSGVAVMVFAPAEMGEIGITPLHTPLLTRLKPGELRVRKPDGSEEYYYVSGGFIEVQPYGVIVLADTALRAHDLDEAAAHAAIERAQEAMAEKDAKISHAQAQAILAQAIAQLRTLERWRKSKHP